METIWKQVTEADMQRHVLNPQLSALRTAALAGGQADPMTGSIEDAIADVRVAIQTCQNNFVSTDATRVPPEWVKWACYLALAAMQTRLPSLKLSDDQKKQIERAEERLDQVRACKLAVTAPSEALSPSNVQRPGGASVVEADATVRTTTREQMSGL
jgi:hypothetical protein